MKKALFTLLILFFGATARLEAQTSAPFPYISIPQIFTSPDEENRWFALHFWDKYNFSNIHQYSTEVTEQGFMEFLEVLKTVPVPVAIEAVEEMMSRAAASEDGYWCQIEMAEVILYDPSSPLRNDLLWEPIMRHALSDKSPLDEESRMRYHNLLRVVCRNQIGTPAANFAYTLPNGRQGTLYDLKADYTLLYFYNPGCSECLRTKEAIMASGDLEFLHQTGVLKVLAIYPDKEVGEWRRRLSENPSWWISAYDKGSIINSQELYDLKAIPTIYLLDSQKRVLLKDPTPENLNRAIAMLAGN